MATLSRELAKKMIKECKAGKRSTYCIVSYEDGPARSYAYCNNETEFQGIVRSRLPGEKVEPLWESPRFKDPKKRQRALATERKAQELRNSFGL